MKKIIITLLFLLTSLFSYGQNVYKDHQVVYKDGNRVFVNEKNGLSVAMSCKRVSGGTRVDYAIENNTGKPINVLHENITAEYRNKKGKVVPLEVRSYKEALNKARTTVLLWGPNNTEKVKSKTQVKDKSGLVVGTVDTESEVYTGALDEAYKEVENKMSDYLKDNTLFDKESTSGFFLTKKPKGEIYTLRFKLGEDTFEYLFYIED